MNSMFESTAARPILGITRASTVARSMSAKNSVSPSVERAQSSLGVVRASSTIRSAFCADEVQILRPEMRQPSPVFSARVVMLPVSSPASGSVTPKQQVTSPAIIGGSRVFFCSSVPNTQIAWGPKILMWIAEAAAMAPGESATVAITNAVSRMPSPAPPTSSGMAMPSQPASAMAA